MNVKRAAIFVSLLAFLDTQAVFANNITISEFFSEDALQMAASPASCGEVENQVYQQAGTVTMSSTGVYEMADAGNLLDFTGIGRGIVDW